MIGPRIIPDRLAQKRGAGRSAQQGADRAGAMRSVSAFTKRGASLAPRGRGNALSAPPARYQGEGASAGCHR